MTFRTPQEVDAICWQLRQADAKRGADRARIDHLFNGGPPYSPEEREQNHVNININDLTAPRLAHDARAQFMANFLKPGQYFTAKTDRGKSYNRRKYGTIVTNHINRIMKRSLKYYECYRSKFALDILHGIGPAAWQDQDRWCPKALSIADLLIPTGTELSFEGLPFFCISRSLTAPELIRMTTGPQVDPAWNMKAVKRSLKWIDKESKALFGTQWQQIWKPEKAEERMLEGGWYAGDSVPTLDVFDFYYWSNEKKQEGWRRRMMIDTWSSNGESRSKDFGRDEWLYNPGARKYADKREELFSCQFADMSAVAPFKYHTVRSLGFLLYAVCHIQNRMRCKFNEAVFEALTMYLRVKSDDDVQRAMKINLMHLGLIDESLEFIPASDRFQVNANLVQLGLATNQKLIEENIASYRQNPDYGSDRIEKTKFQVMAELNATTQLVSGAIQQAYQYQLFEFIEIFRRFCKKGSKDPDVLEFQAACLKDGVPEDLLHSPGSWNIEPEKVMGGGNKSMELAISQQLMSMRSAYDPDAQRQILRDVTLAMTDDPGRTRQLVPEAPAISNSIHDAQLSFGTLMSGAPLAIKDGLNSQEVVATLIISMASVVQKINGMGGMATQQQLLGLGNVSQHISENIQLLAQDEARQQVAKEFSDQLNQLNNALKGFAQRLAEQQASQNGNGANAELEAKIQAMIISAQAKADNVRKSHSEKTAQRQVSFEQTMEQNAQRAELELATEAAKANIELQKEAAKARKPKERE